MMESYGSSGESWHCLSDSGGWTVGVCTGAVRRMNVQCVHGTRNPFCNTCKPSFHLDHCELLQLVTLFSCYGDQRSIKAECVSPFSTSLGW